MSGISDLLLDDGVPAEKMTAAAFDAFAKSIAIVATTLNPKFINIAKSQLLATADHGRAIYRINFADVFTSSKNMAFINNKKDIRALRDIGGNRPILISDNENFFYVTNDVTVTTLKKYRGRIPQISLQDLTDKDQIGESIAIDDTESLVNAVKGSKYVGLFIYDQQLHGFITSNSVFKLFEPESCHDAIGKEPDCIVKSYSFLKMCGSKANLKLYKTNDQFWLVTTTNINKVRKGGKKGQKKKTTIGPEVTIYEKVRAVGMSEFPNLLRLLSNRYE